MDNSQFVEANRTLNEVLGQAKDSAQMIDLLWHRYRLCVNQGQRDGMAMALIGLVAAFQFGKAQKDNSQ